MEMRLSSGKSLSLLHKQIRTHIRAHSYVYIYVCIGTYTGREKKANEAADLTRFGLNERLFFREVFSLFGRGL